MRQGMYLWIQVRKMATIRDLEEIRKAMDEVRENPNQCRYVGVMQITYAEHSECFIATFEADLDIYFDDVDYSSNNIILKRGGVPIGTFCHIHQRLSEVVR